MNISVNSFIKRGYVPLTLNRYAAVAWQGEPLKDFWMWNGGYLERGGVRYIQTIRVADLKEAAIRYWQDGWAPVKLIDEAFLRRMENSLRAHKGLRAQGVKFPESPFLRMPEHIPAENLSPEARELLGL